MIKTLKPLLSLLFIFQLSFAQEQVISGNITDSTGVPLNGVTIVLDGTSTGVISDFDGNYLVSAGTFTKMDDQALRVYGLFFG